MVSTPPRLLSLGRAVPERRYTQAELYEHNPWERSALLDRLFLESPVHTRALFVPPEFWRQKRTLTETNSAWLEGALLLSSRALHDALDGAERTPADVDLIAVTTVTGYATPGLDLLLAAREELRGDVQRVHFNNIGCHAAVPLLRVAADHAARRPGSLAAACAVEVCSACFALDDDPQNLVALSLFADGSACAAVSTEGDGPAIVDFASGFDFGAIEALGFSLGTHGFRIVLDPAIPGRIASGLGRVIDGLLERNGLSRTDVATWCLHPGGARILDAAQQALGLTDVQMGPSRGVLRDYGNMSSPSVLFVLAESMQAAPPPPGAPIVLAAFGPGLGIEAALLRV
jgi:alkylresorcinol/alkylpyrone synthase